MTRGSTPAILADAAAVAAAVADRILISLDAALQARPEVHFVLAGGSTPRLVNAALVQPRRHGLIDWRRVHFWFGDERYVPQTNTASNYRMNCETLLDPLNIAHDHVHPIGTMNSPETEALEYDTLLTNTLGSHAAFDLVLLGLGPDGHTASLFPGTVSNLDRVRLCVAHHVDKLSSWRITLTPRAFNGARTVVCAAAGAAKATALRAVLEGPYDPDVFPAQLIVPRSGAPMWYVDEPAARLLSRAEPGPPW